MERSRPLTAAATIAALVTSLLLVVSSPMVGAGELRPACSACEDDLSHIGNVAEFTLGEGEHRSFTDDLDDLHHLHYNLTVISGGPVQLLILDKENYQAFEGNDAYSALHNSTADPSSPAAGLYETASSAEHVLVVMNEGQGDSEVSLRANMGLEGGDNSLAAVVAIALLALIAVAFYRRAMNR